MGVGAWWTFDAAGPAQVAFPLAFGRLPFAPASLFVVNNTAATLYLSRTVVSPTSSLKDRTIPPRFAMPVQGWYAAQLYVGSDGAAIAATDHMTIEASEASYPFAASMMLPPLLLTAPGTLTYAKLSQTDRSTLATVSNGDLTVETVAGTAASTNPAVRGTIGKSSGKWYWEITVDREGGSGSLHGIGSSSQNLLAGAGFVGLEGLRCYYSTNGNKYTPSTAYKAAYTTGAKLGCALDMDAGTFVMYTNGANPSTLVTALSGPIFPYLCVPGDGATGAKATANFGASSFTYAQPAGYNPGLYQ